MGRIFGFRVWTLDVKVGRKPWSIFNVTLMLLEEDYKGTIGVQRTQ